MRAGRPTAGRANATVAVVDPDSLDEAAIGSIGEPYVLIYKQGAPYRGALPPGAQITFANSGITLDARLLEALGHHEARA